MKNYKKVKKHEKFMFKSKNVLFVLGVGINTGT
jgi:hypothetical protein